MSAFACPHCGETTKLYPDARAERSVWAHDVPLLARLPFDRAVARAAEVGRPALAGETGIAFDELAECVATTLSAG